MIETFCGCGGEVRADESAVAAACTGCGRTVRLAAGEPLAKGMGLGDFDARLVVHAGPGGVGETIALGGVPDLLVGKADDRHVRLAGGTLVSRAHAKLVRVDFGPSRWKVVDTASRNGVFVNGERVAEAELTDGDVLGVGEFELHYRTDRPVVAPPPPPPIVGGVACPGCQTVYVAKAKFCTSCGIDIRTGKPLVISRELDENTLAHNADALIRGVSWVMPFGLFPIASEAFGTKRATAIWWIAGVTVLASLAFFVPYYADNLAAQAPWMMWCGSGGGLPAEVNPDVAHFRLYQLFTAALIHAGVMHLAGNMVFMLVFGIRVNELIGNAKMAVVYPILAVGSGMVLWVASRNEMLHPSLGASGAIMGLAGMYLVFFPVQRVVMAIWLRLFTLRSLMFGRSWCGYKIFRMRGVWLLGLWVGWNDVLPTVLANAQGGTTHDGVAHWAHLGGFMVGVAIAVGMLIGRQVNAHGSDLLSVTLGTKAWPLLGKPGERMTG